MAQPSLGRLHRHWSFDSLAKEADLVVIAEAESGVDSGERFHELWGEFGGVTTTFRVEAVLKGKFDGTKFRLLHYRIVRADPIPGTPRRLAFKLASPGRDGGHYLLFLKRRNDGRCEPVSGQIDPGDAVRELNSPPHLEDDVGPATTQATR
jgi:hypothetical protein